MQQKLALPFHLGYDDRNKIINENCTKFKDITRLPNQYDVLTSYVPEKRIFDGINNRIGKTFFSKAKANFAVSNSVEAFEKNQVTTRYGLLRQVAKNIAYSHKSSKLNCGFNFSDLALLGSKNVAVFDDTALKAYWKFNEASGDIINQSQSAVDLGSAADGQVDGMTYVSTGGGSPFGYEGIFDGVNDDVTIGTSLSQFNYMHNTSALWTIAWWMQADQTGLPEGGVFNSGDGVFISQNVGMNIYYVSTGTALKMNVNKGGTQGDVATKTTSANYIPDTNWHFYTITYDQAPASNNVNIRRDNANLEQATKTGATPSSANHAHAGLIGIVVETDRGPFNGSISELSNWNKVMTTGDQTDMYKGGVGREIY